MSRKQVSYHGVKMAAHWPARIEAAQALTHYTMGGRKFARIPFGEEDPRWGQKPCLNCGVLKGQLHVPDCEYEKCPACGEIRAGRCECDIEELREPDEDPIAPARQRPLARKLVIVLGWILLVLLLVVLWTLFNVVKG